MNLNDVGAYILRYFQIQIFPKALWGPVSISIFLTLHSIYKRALCFDGVEGYIFYVISKYKTALYVMGACVYNLISTT